jgi:hypothetical protein
MLPLKKRFLLFYFGLMSITGATGIGYADEVFNTRKEMVYSYRATLEREEEKNRRIQLQQYEQRLNMQKRKLIEQQDMYNLLHQKSGIPDYMNNSDN